LKVVRQKKNNIKVKTVKITADFATETLQARRHGVKYFKPWKKTISAVGYSTQQNYNSKLMKEKVFLNKQKLKQYMTTKTPLCRTL
jgi:hypothetical protein